MSDTLDRLQAALADRYQVNRELGAGGMATVFLATDLKHEREVAIKVLHPDLSASMGPERFDREIRLAARLQHPHILSLYDSGAADGLLYYVMPFVSGESLRDRLDREKLLPVEDAIQIALEVADALGYAHSMGVIHRDIKPENIMLSGGHALVADFGIARAMGTGEKLTQAGMAVGTPVYMSPEQSVGDEVGPTADLYSLGCVLYEMLAGTPPFTGPNSRAIMARHAMDPVPGLQILRETIPDEVEDAVFAVLAKQPADRPQTAAQFCEMLGTPVGGTAARRAGARLSSARVTMSRRTAARQAATLEEAPPLWRRPAVLSAGATLALLVIGFAVWKLTSGRAAPGATLGGPDRHNIAVLYFEDQSPKHDLAYLADGLTEGLISALGSVQGLTVVSKGGVVPYRGGTISKDSVARALKVGTLVTGSVEPDGGAIRVTVRVLDDAGTELDRATFLKPAQELVALADSLSEQAAVLIRKRIGESIQLSRTRAGTQNTDAWATYQRALQGRGRGDSLFRAGDAPGFAREYLAADSLAGIAERLDPRWPDPIVLRGTLNYWRSRHATGEPGLANKTIDAGLVHAERALALDKNNADALELRGDLNYWRFLYPLEPDSIKRKQLLLSAQADLERATQLNPSQASAYAMLSHLYANNPEKSLVDAILAASQALEKDAYLSNADAVLNRLAHATYDLGQFADADRWCGEGRRRFPADPRFVECELLNMTSKFKDPDPARAWRLADSVVQLTPDGLDRRYQQLNTRVLVAGVLARAGNKDSARAVLRGAKVDPEVDAAKELANYSAFVWTLVGDTTEALNQIKSYLVANPGRRADFRDNPNWWFRGISNDPRYQAIVGSPR